ncbi:MAG: FliO/MopB family protein [Magnetovibrio sp.]|nr:FliO/MopB family protein [Magnetovibrio sp.]
MDTVNYIKFILALLFVLSLIGLLALAVRRFGFGVPQIPFKRAAEKRLGMIELMPIDAKRRLVLVRRDDQEHLILSEQPRKPWSKRTLSHLQKMSLIFRKPWIRSTTMRSSKNVGKHDRF